MHLLVNFLINISFDTESEQEDEEEDKSRAMVLQSKQNTLPTRPNVEFERSTGASSSWKSYNSAAEELHEPKPQPPSHSNAEEYCVGKQTLGDKHVPLCESSVAVSSPSFPTGSSFNRMPSKPRADQSSRPQPRVRDATPPPPQLQEYRFQNRALQPARVTPPTAATSSPVSNARGTDTETPRESWTQWFARKLNSLW